MGRPDQGTKGGHHTEDPSIVRQEGEGEDENEEKEYPCGVGGGRNKTSGELVNRGLGQGKRVNS